MISIFLAILVLVICFLILPSLGSMLKWFKKKEKQKIEPVEKRSQTEIDDQMEAAAQFMVTDQDKQKKEEKIKEKEPEKVYQPVPVGVNEPAKVHEPTSQDTEHFKGYDVEVKELPKPEEVEIDASWIEMDVSKDYKIIVKELSRKKVNCYGILGIQRNADSKTIHKAYRKLASQYHPDKGTNIVGLVKEQIMEKIREINYSKDILLNPTMRAFHDQAMREREKNEPVIIDQKIEELDPSMLELVQDGTGDTEEETEEKTEGGNTIVIIDDDDSMKKNIGVLLFRKWDDEHEHFSDEFMDYMIQLDDEGYVDYGRMMKGDVDDIDDLYKLKKISNYSQAANNALTEVWIRPPFYYLALPVLSREYVQEICDMLKESFNLDSLFFTYP